MADYTLQDAMELVLDAPDIDGVVIDPWGHSATLDEALLNGLLHAGHNPEEPGDEEVEAGREAARAGDWRMAADHYDEAAQQGNAMGLSLLADCLYRGRGEMQNKTEARRMWRTAADHGEVLAMLSLGEDCAARGEAGKALLYYRKARQTAQSMPDIEYTPRICLRLAQAETRYVSAKRPWHWRQRPPRALPSWPGRRNRMRPNCRQKRNSCCGNWPIRSPGIRPTT